VLLFTLHEGAEFTIDEVTPTGWLKIVLADGKKGWIRKSDTISAQHLSG